MASYHNTGKKGLEDFFFNLLKIFLLIEKENLIFFNSNLIINLGSFSLILLFFKLIFLISSSIIKL